MRRKRSKKLIKNRKKMGIEREEHKTNGRIKRKEQWKNKGKIVKEKQ